MSDVPETAVSQILAAWSDGDGSAAERLMPLVYQELRALAGEMFRDQPRAQTLQPTALVHEAYLRLAGQSSPSWNDRQHFFRVAAKAMRQLLTDAARRRRAQKRGGDQVKLTLGSDPPAAGEDPFDVMVLDDAICRLTALDERQGQIVELRFLGGLSVEETAAALGVSPRTVELDSRLAKAWLQRELRGGDTKNP
ncbi:hypothetical protein B7486_07050 [cyanobacterium TDX16]|nr:hypothetical protein B7486_07050 [cyanobacterium TDX16]